MTHPHKIHTAAVFHKQPLRERLCWEKRGGDDLALSPEIITTGNLGLPCVAMTPLWLSKHIHTPSTQDPHKIHTDWHGIAMLRGRWPMAGKIPLPFQPPVGV
jgi:hypothetical protein